MTDIQTNKKIDWTKNFILVREFIEKNNRLPKRGNKSSQEEIKLSRWCQYQKILNRNNELSNKRITRLEKLPFWKWDILSRTVISWDEQFELFKKYIEMNKRLDSSSKDISPQLGKWIKRQVIGYKENTLSDERRKKLESINGWDILLN